MDRSFENMVENFQKVIGEVCSEWNYSLSAESLYSICSSREQGMADALDCAVRHLLKAESKDLGDAARGEEIRVAKGLVGKVLEQIKNESSSWGLDGSAGDEGSCEVRSGVLRKGSTVFVDIDHESETNFFTDITSEISRGGLFVATYDILRAGTPVNIQLSLPCGRSFPMQGFVSWVREFESCAEGASPGMGVTFKNLTAEFTAAISNYMAKRPPLLFEMA
jgi:uncharacterized protein (TIGR02266 family)